MSGVSQLHASSLVPSSSNTPDLNFDQYLLAAFGASLDHSEVPTAATRHDWVSRWSTIAHLKGKLYHVPVGSFGHHYVE